MRLAQTRAVELAAQRASEIGAASKAGTGALSLETSDGTLVPKSSPVSGGAALVSTKDRFGDDSILFGCDCDAKVVAGSRIQQL